MKGNKKILVVAVLLLLIAVSYSTYAIYKSEASSSDSVRAAHWVIEVNDTDIVTSNTFALGTLDCGSTPVSKVNGAIAPGDTCTATIEIDATGSEVAVDYNVAIDTSALTTLANSEISVAPHTGSTLTGTINYSASSMTQNVVLDVTWNAVDSTTQNAKDIETALADLTIPVTVTVTQNPNPAA